MTTGERSTRAPQANHFATMLAVAAETAHHAGLSNVTTQVMDAQRLDVEPESFDAAISRLGLMFIPDLQGALAGIRRALKPGGKLAAVVVSSADMNRYFALHILLPVFSMAIEIACAGVVVTYIRGMTQRTRWNTKAVGPWS